MYRQPFSERAWNFVNIEHTTISLILNIQYSEEWNVKVESNAASRSLTKMQ